MSASPLTAAPLSDTAAEAIRGLNHATRHTGGGLEFPGDAYTTVANLSTLAMRLPQAIDQIRDFIDRLDAQALLRSDNGPDDLAQRLENFRADMAAASRSADILHVCLDQAHTALGPIGHAP